MRSEKSISITMPEAWNEIISSDRPFILIPTGRVSGKTNNTVKLSVMTMLAFPDSDIVCTRSSYGSMMDSLYAEFEAEFDEMPDEISDMFEFKRSPLRIERTDGRGTIYFIGSGGSNKDRTKGLKTKHKVKIVIIDEAQEFKDKESYEQFMASVRRNLGEAPKVIVLGNPPAIEVHWFNMFVKAKENDKAWLVKRMTWRDIYWYLNRYDIKEILKCKYLEPEYYRWMYEGIPTGGLGQVYPMFRPDIHIVQYNRRDESRLIQDFRIVGCVIGCDGAVNHDCTVLVPRIIYSNGQSMAAKIFLHDPLKDGVQGSFPLVEKCVTRWFKELREENGLDNPYSFMSSVPICFVVDSAATELIQALQYYFGNRATIHAIKKGTIVQMVDTVQSAIGKNVIGIYDYGGYFDYMQNKWITCDNPLAYQYRTLIWNESQTGYDPKIPNDASDADTYGIYFYYGTQGPESITWLKDVASRRKDYYILKQN